MVIYVHSYNISPLNDADKIAMRGYNSFIQHFFSQEFARIALRLFFSISGYLFFLNFKGTIEDYISKLKKRAKLLLVPFVFWSAMWILIYFCLQSFSSTRSLFEGTLIKELHFTGFLGTLFLHPIPFQLWSIRDLILLAVLSPILYFLIKHLKYVVIIIFLVAWYLQVDFYILSNESVLFFTIGGTLSILKSQILTVVWTKKQSIFIVIWIAICLSGTILDHLNSKNIFIADLLHKTGILFGIVSIWILYDILPKYKNIEESKFFDIFTFSFFIFAFHIPMLTFVRKILFKFGNTEFISFTIYIFAPLIVISASLLTGFFLKKTIPNFYKIISGGR